jgi:acid phosphatase type 7
MFIRKKAVKSAAVTFCALTIVGLSAVSSGVKAQAATANDPYNINAGIGSNESEIRFSWESTSSATGELQIAKTGDVKSGSFPADSTKQASIEKATATEGVEDTPNNTDQPISSLKDASGAALPDEYSDKVTVDGLAPNTSYTYRVGDGTTWSKNYTIQTGSSANGFSFAAFGDPQIGASGNVANDQAGWANTLKTVYSKFPSVNFMFSMGDQVNDYDHVYAQQKEYNAFFNPDSSIDYLQTHVLAAFSGNHDFQMGKYYSFHYNQPNLSTLGQTKTNGVDDNNGDYWFRYGNTLFMVLEGNSTYDVSAHDAFLKQAVAANPDAKWKVASFHQAPYSEANHDGSTASDDDIMFMRQNWPTLMDKYHVDVVLNGHDHYYTRTYQMYGGSPVNTTKTNKVTNPKGTVYFTLDSGSGSKYYKYNTTADHSFSSFGWQNNVPTYTYAKVTGDTFTLTTYATNSNTPIDTYTITKNSASPTAAGVSTTKAAPTASNPRTGDNESGTYAIVAVAAAALLIAAGCVLFLKKREADHN